MINSFKDRDAVVFDEILYYLRNGSLLLHLLSQKKRELLLCDAIYFNLLPLQRLLEAYDQGNKRGIIHLRFSKKTWIFYLLFS